MANIVIGVFSPDGQKRGQIAGALGKKGSADDITVYNTNFSGKLVTVVEPTLYPKKLEALLYCAYLSDYCILAADTLNAELGETIVALDLLGKKAGCLVGTLDWDMLTKGTNLAGFARAESEEEARRLALAHEPAPREGATVAIVDHAFDVKGVGSVALGFVMHGAVKVHDKFRPFPKEGQVEVRSIQMQDHDVQSAGPSDRFGISFKGMKSDDLGRGLVLAQECPVVKEASGTLEVSKFCKKPVADGETLHFACGLLMVAGKIALQAPAGAGSNSTAKITLEQPLAAPATAPIIACRLNEKGLRLAGRVRL